MYNNLIALQGHSKGVFPVLYIPFERETVADEPNGNDPKNEKGTTDEDEPLGPQGDVIVTGSFDCTARTWDLLSGRCLKVDSLSGS